MRTLRTAVLAGAAALALAAAPGLARAESPTPHVMTVHLPDGGVARIQYSGDVAPRVTAVPIPMPFMPAAFGPGSPFAMLQRMSAAMDREADAMMRQAAAMFGMPMPSMFAGPLPAGFGAAPPGSEAFSFASSTNGHGVCMRSMTITSAGPGMQPHVVRQQSGDCGPAGHGAVPAQEHVTPAPSPARHGNLVRVRYDGTQKPTSPLRPIAAAWQG